MDSMGKWNAVHAVVKAIQERARSEFLVEISDEAMATAIDGVLEMRLGDMLSEEFGKLSAVDLLTAREIVKTDKDVLKRAQAEKPKRGGLN